MKPNPDTLHSPYFTLAELTHSTWAKAHGVDNTPDPYAVDNLRTLCAMLLTPLRRDWGEPITVTSGYRCKAVNTAVGGATNSQHMHGCAADITTGDAVMNRRLMAFILADPARYPFDQLIAEQCDDCGNPRWLHVSYTLFGRNQFLIKYKKK